MAHNFQIMSVTKRKYVRRKPLSENKNRTGRKTKTISQDQIDLVFSLREDGNTQHQIEDEVGISRYYVRKILSGVFGEASGVYMSDIMRNPIINEPNITPAIDSEGLIINEPDIMYDIPAEDEPIPLDDNVLVDEYADYYAFDELNDLELPEEVEYDENTTSEDSETDEYDNIDVGSIDLTESEIYE